MKRIFLLVTLVLLSGCQLLPKKDMSFGKGDGPPKRSVDVSKIPNAKPKHLPKSRYGNPASYVVQGRRYFVLKTAKGYNQRGIASWYGTKFQGRLTSSREPYDMFAMTAASPVLPIPTFVRVTNLANDRSIIVKVNDRGPFAPNRIIDLSYAGAKKLGYIKQGTAMVQVTAIDTKRPYLTPAPHLNHTPTLFLQVGAFSNREDAEQMKARAASISKRKVRVYRGRTAVGTLYKVQVGPLRGSGEADNLQQRLARAGLNSFSVVK